MEKETERWREEEREGREWRGEDREKREGRESEVYDRGSYVRPHIV